MGESIVGLLDSLPTDNITVKTLNALDVIVPNQWNNVVGADKMIMSVTGESDANVVMAIRNRAIELFNSKGNGYQRALWVYQTVDKMDTALGAAALANKVGEKIGFLGFLSKITPKADKLQAADLCLKIVAELVAYSKLNGLPVLKPKEFVSELQEHYTDAALMRMVALVCFDGLLPLGPNFLKKVENMLSNEGRNAFVSNPVFSALADSIPDTDKFGFVANTFGSVSGWMEQIVGSAHLTPESIFTQISRFVDFADDNLDLVAAFLDQSTNYFEHTGIQSVARPLILAAAKDVV